jgi:hypothetical protein
MPLLEPIRFQGALSIAGAEAPVGFLAGIDDDGQLTLELDPIVPASVGVPFVPNGMPLQTEPVITLRGRSESGWSFDSQSFHIARWHHPEGRVEISGGCRLAEISRDARPDHIDMRAWFFRRLATIHGMERRTPLGRLVFVGYRDGADQEPVAALAIHAPGREGQQWWDATERLLIHLERVLSFACGVYLVPVYEQCVRAGVMTLRVAQRGRTSGSYMAPFDLLFMERIFDCALRSFEERPNAVERLDPAIRWITASVAYEESRLINAMSALESIVARSDVPGRFMDDDEAFAEIKRKVRRCLKDAKAPGRMGGKVDELNRRSFREKIETLIATRGIMTADFPPGWLSAIIEARNIIVHTGVAPDFSAPDARLLDHIVWAREIATRIILEAIGFEGRFLSWLHRSEYLSFPSCRRESEVAVETSGPSQAGAEEE